MTPLGLDQAALYGALQDYRRRLRALVGALGRDRSAARADVETLTLLDELMTTVEVDTAVRELPEGLQRMSLPEATILKPLLMRVRSELDSLPVHSPDCSWLPRLRELESEFDAAERAALGAASSPFGRSVAEASCAHAD